MPSLERGDGSLKIVPADRQNSRFDRIGSVGAVEHPRTFLFGGDIAFKKLSALIQIANQCTHPYHFG